MMEEAGVLLIGTAIALMLISPFHVTLAHWRNVLIDPPPKGQMARSFDRAPNPTHERIAR